MSKYSPLRHFLEGRESEQVPMTFAEVEHILAFPLPASARARAGWWSNNPGTHVGVSAWRDAGWKASRVDVASEKLVFVRADKPAGAKQEGAENIYSVNCDQLSPAAARLLSDYRREMNGDAAAALARAVHEAAVARRGRLIDQIVTRAPRVRPGEADSVALVREDRDVR